MGSLDLILVLSCQIVFAVKWFGMRSSYSTSLLSAPRRPSGIKPSKVILLPPHGIVYSKVFQLQECPTEHVSTVAIGQKTSLID